MSWDYAQTVKPVPQGLSAILPFTIYGFTTDFCLLTFTTIIKLFLFKNYNSMQPANHTPKYSIYFILFSFMGSIKTCFP